MMYFISGLPPKNEPVDATRYSPRRVVPQCPLILINERRTDTDNSGADLTGKLCSRHPEQREGSAFSFFGAA